MEEDKGIAPDFKQPAVMCLEDLKSSAPPMAKIKKMSPVGAPPSLAQAEWGFVKTAEDAKKWHLKWTPWFTECMIDGIVKYAYLPK